MFLIYFKLAIVGFALLTNKSTDLYQKMLSVVTRKTEWTPNSAYSDWESALRSAIRVTWKNIKIFGCRFHFAQALRKHALSLKLFKLLKSSREASRCFEMLTKLCLLPESSIEKGYEDIQSYIKLHRIEKDFKPFIKYFERQWVRRVKLKNLSIHGARYTTNNILENYHGRDNKRMPAHPGIFQFLSKFFLT
jgi:MULE transposase domain